MRCCPSQPVRRESCFCVPKAFMERKRKKKTRVKEGIRVESRSLLIIISAAVCGVRISTSHTTHRWTPHYTQGFLFFSFSLRLATVDFHSLNFSIQSHMAACVQINWFVVGRAFFFFHSAWYRKYATAWGGGQRTFPVVWQSFTRRGTARFTGTETCDYTQ